MGNGASTSNKEKQKDDGRVVSSPQPRSQQPSPPLTQSQLHSAQAAPVACVDMTVSNAPNSNKAVFSSTQIEVETKVSSARGSSTKRHRDNSKTTRQTAESFSSAQKVIITERMVAQFTKENHLGRGQEKRNKELAVMDWCNSFYPTVEESDANRRHDVLMRELRDRRQQLAHGGRG